jgi:hypothetical protein
MTEDAGADVRRRSHSLTTLRSNCVPVQEVWTDNRFAVVISRSADHAALHPDRPTRRGKLVRLERPAARYLHQDTWSVVGVAIKAPFENDEL